MRLVALVLAGMIGNGALALGQDDSNLHFGNDILPIFNRYGCNTSGCHGKAEGQNGFKLSVFGFDPAADHEALTHESRGRRVLPSLPDQSLLLLKASGGMPHGGGVRIARNSEDYQTLRRWIASGMPVGRADAPHITRLSVAPSEQVLTLRSRQPLRVTAHYSDGRALDVTRFCRFQSNRESVATVDETGVVTTQDVPGDVAVMAAYLESLAVFTALVPRPEESDLPRPAAQNRIDELVDAKLSKLRIVPSPVCDDATFLRRVSLDLIGRLPTPAECRQFLADPAADKRSRVVESLFGRPEYAEYWALKWSDWLRVDRQSLGHRAAYAYYKWIRDSIATNQPFDAFARELLTADGLITDRPAVSFYKVAKDPGDAAAMMCQALLGVRIECAKCHHHPFDRWSQEDYFGMQSYFLPLSFKPSPRGELLVALKKDVARHPRTNAIIPAHPLGAAVPSEDRAGDRRPELAAWLTQPDNPFFARNLANRVWAHFLGRGIVEPIDDVRASNPPTNPELHAALATDLVQSGFDMRQLMRTIIASRTYQSATTVNATNSGDDQNFSRAVMKRLPAEVLLDAICDATGVPEKFEGVPAGVRAVQLWDSQATSYFLTTTGRPSRTTVCECERVGETTVAYVLHALNSPHLEAKFSHDNGRVARLVREHPNGTEPIIEELYLAFFSRLPRDVERQAAVQHLEKAGVAGRQAAVEDLAWSLMNSLEFTFNH